MEQILKFAEKNKIYILLIVLNIIFRIPTRAHELGVDSFLVHSQAEYISINGHASWIVHPLSIFGMYPYSVPSAIPFLQSGLSQLLTLNMEKTILITSIMIGIMGTIAMYSMAKEMTNDELVSILATFCFSVSPLFLSYTIWTTSTRHLYMALIPLFIWTLIKIKKNHKNNLQYKALAIILFLFIGTVHHMVIFLLPVLIAFYGIPIGKKINIDYSGYRISNTPTLSLIFAILAILFVILQINKLFIYDDFNIWSKYQSGYFFNGLEATTLFGNMMVDYVSKIGLLSVFIILAIMIYLRKPNRESYLAFPFIVVLIFAPLYSWGWYVPSVLIPFISILCGYGLSNLRHVRSIKNIFPSILVLAIFLSSIFSLFMLWHWDISSNHEIESYAFDSDINLASFLKVNGPPDSTIVSHSKQSLISAVSGFATPPPDIVHLFDLVNKSDMNISYTFSQSSIKKIDSPDAIYSSSIDYRKEYYRQPLNVDKWEDYRSKYNIIYAIKNPFPKGWGSSLYNGIAEINPKIYDNGKLSICYIGGE